MRDVRSFVHTEVPPCRCRLEDPSLNGDPDLTRPRTEGRREGALRLSGLVFRFRLLRSGLGLEELRCGSPPVRTQLVQQLLTEEVQVQVLQEQAPILKFVEDRRGALHRFHLVRLLGLFLGDGGGVEPGLNLEGLHRRRVEGSALLALFLVAWQWGPLPRWGRQKLLVQLHGAVPDHRPDRGGDEVREAGLVRVLAGHRVGGQLADVHRGTELEVAGPVRVRAFGTCGPGRRPDRIALVIHRQLPMRARHLQGGRVGRRVNGLRLLAAPHALRGALLHPAWCSRGRSRMWAPCPGGGSPGPRTPSQRACQPAVPGAEPGLMLVLHLGDVEGLHNALQAPLLELGALKASQEPLDVLACSRRSLVVAVVSSKQGKSPAIWSSLNW